MGIPGLALFLVLSVGASSQGASPDPGPSPSEVLERGRSLLDGGDSSGAIAAYQEALRLARGAASPRLRALALLGLADARDARGEPREAVARFQEALAVVEASGTEADRIQVLTAFAQRSKHRGDLDRASTLFQRALLLADGDLHSEAVLQGEIANLLLMAGDYRSSRDAYVDLVEAGRRLESERIVAVAQYMLGMVHRLLGETARAEEALTRALEPEGALADFERARVLNELGVLYGELDRDDERKELHRSALEIARGPTGSPEVAVEALSNLVDAYEKSGELERARELQEEALDIARAGSLERLVALGEANLDYLCFLADEPIDVDGLWTRIETLEGLHDEEATLAALDTLARYAIRGGRRQLASQAMARSRRILEDASLNALSPAERSRWRSRYSDWGRTEQDRIALVLSEDPEEPDVIRAGLAAAGRWKGRALLEHVTSGVEPAERPLDLPRLRERLLPGGGALIEYAPGWERLYAYVLTPGGLRHFDVGHRKTIEDRVAGYVRGLSDLEHLSTPEALATEGRDLYEMLLGRLLPELGEGVERLVLVPSPALADLPFEALVLRVEEDGGPPASPRDLEFAIDRFRIAYGPSTAFLDHAADAGPADRPLRALVLADPVYRGEPSMGLRRLIGTREEAIAFVRRLLLASEPATDRVLAEFIRHGGERSFSFVTDPRVDLFVGADASPERLKGDLTKYSLIHLATHGLVDLERPEASGIVLSPTDGSSGFVPVEELSGLRLDADLTVLAACETARGRVRPGEGVLSMARAFLRAGSRSVVASLWAVRDDEASQAMQEFARLYVEEGLSPAESLRRAKLQVRDSTGVRGLGVRVTGRPIELSSAHPFFWAPFVYVGSDP